ncbi:hypothetical protein CBS101457_000378 [Exobasidium rhododendri]|nr:hypothetical protein CBS101457_000378 [Exobasidium rhododendri]
MHPALIVLFVVFGSHLTTLIGRERIQSSISPLYLRLFHSQDTRIQKQLKKTIYETRQQLNKTSSQDEFAKWAKLRRSVDKSISQLEATNARLASASSTLGLLLRVVLFLSTTLFPFVLTFYFGKTPMFFLPPSGTTASTSRPARMAPGGFTIPHNPNHAWDLANETYLGPMGWLLSMTGAPRGSVSAGMWSTVCTRVALLVTNRLRETFLVVSSLASSRVPTSSDDTLNEKPMEASRGKPVPAAGMSEKPESLRKRTTTGPALD